MVSKSFFALRELVGSSGTFGCFAICNLAAAVFVACLVPETKGKSLTEIQKMYVVGAEKLLDRDVVDVDKVVDGVGNGVGHSNLMPVLDISFRLMPTMY